MGAGTSGGPRGPRGGFIAPGGDGPGVRPPKEGDKGPGIRPPEGGFGGPGIRPPKSEPTPPRIDPIIPPNEPKYTPQGNTFSNRSGLFGSLMEGIKKTDKFKDKVKEGGKGIGVPDKKSPEIFDKLLEGIKKGGFGGQRRPIGGMSSRPAPGSNIPLGPNDRPIGFERPRDDSDFITQFGDTRDPNYAENKRKALEEKYGRPMGSGALSGGFPRTPRDIGLGGGPSIPPRFPTGPKDPRAMRGPRKEAVSFGGKPPSAESRRPTKEGPKRGMSKAGPVDAETRNKFEEMLAYMKSFQR